MLLKGICGRTKGLYDATANANLPRRDRMIWLAQQRRSVVEIAAIVFRSHATVERVLKRFLSGGVTAISSPKAPGWLLW
jgi:hypothetical protein